MLRFGGGVKAWKMQYSLTVTYRQKHDSSDFPVDYALSVIICVSEMPYEWLFVGETVPFTNANSVLKSNLCLEKQKWIWA